MKIPKGFKTQNLNFNKFANYKTPYMMHTNLLEPNMKNKIPSFITSNLDN